MNRSRDLNTFRIGQIVDVPGLDVYQGIEITRISDSGVTIDGVEGKSIVLSGKTPAVLSSRETGIAPSVSEKILAKATAQGKLKNIEAPAETFTIKQLAVVNGVPILYATNWIKENCEATGFAPKAEGQRGRAAQLFKVKK